MKPAAGDTVTGLSPELRLGISGSFTVDPVLPALRLWLRELQIAGVMELAPYGQVVQTLLDPASVFKPSQRAVNLVLLRVSDWLRDLPPDGDCAVHLQRAASDFERAMRAHRARGGNPTLLMICPSPPVSRELEPLVDRTQQQLVLALDRVSGLQVVQSSAFHERYGVSENGIHDSLRDQIGHIPYTDAYFHVLATVAMRHAYRRISPLRKVVVVDADNTLWRGVVGETGPDGIALDEGHRSLHRTLVRLAENGVLVAICSKNEERDVWEVFDARTDFDLRREHIVAAAINWQSKSQNLRALASRLNLGLDSFLFIDDNPLECAEVRAHCPEVLTLGWPQDPAAAIRLLEHTWELDAIEATAEDTRRTEMYREELQRRELRESTLTLREFLGSLDLRIDIATLTPADLRRASQLTLRTNQFNFTTRRRDESQMQALVSEGRHEIRTVRVRDRFGDYGLVGLIVAEWHDDEVVADTFLLSCRVLGRGVEHHMAAEFGRMALARGLDAVSLQVDFTKKNTPARQFLQSIAPAGRLVTTDDRLECRFASGDLAALRFEPSEDSGALTDGEEDVQPAAKSAVQASELRGREAQILKTVSELSTVGGLATAIAGRATDANARQLNTASEHPAQEDVSNKVYAAFASALHTSPARVQALDRLETLGCDSLKIVEITVDLIEAFPWVPPTLLFEHRTVSDIARAIAALRAPAETPAASRREPAATDPHIGSADIAVVGINLRCAGAASPDELWDLLSAGRSAVAPVPADRRHFLHPLVDIRPHWAGLLDDVARFDAEFFGVSPREAEYMDPQLRLFLEVAWGALEDAGCVGANHDAETGVFAGVMYGDYGARANVGPTASPYRCWEGFSLANRLSQLLGFNGPSFAVDTACSSSGTALHLACASLRADECRVAVAGGVNLILDPDRFGSLGRLGILSMRGRCEAFGADADGTVLGEGAGVVILRTLDDALRRGDRIYGVIKGTGLSTGSGTVGFTAPNPQAQSEAIRRGLRAAGIDPRTISYVETHGTGTALGDPIEVRGLTLGYGAQDLHDRTLTIEHRCTLGSIKPNIGHLEAGAGVLGLMKVLLQLQHRTLLPSLTSSEPNPQIPFAQSPFDVQRVLAEWRRPIGYVDGVLVTLPRRAGLSSFGVGGANAHVIVEEPPAAAPRSAAAVDRPLHLLALSARNESSLKAQADRVLRYVEQETDLRVADLCFSLENGREHFEHRVAVPVATRDDVQHALQAVVAGKDVGNSTRGVTPRSVPKIAFLFTGQGSQYARMGRQLYDTQPVFRAAIDRAAAHLDRVRARPLLDVLFAEGSADAELVHQTEYTQPALFVFECAMSQLWRSWGINPDIVLGHSIGEIAAMCVAGGLTLEDGLKLVEARGRLMQALPPGGAMTSVMADEQRVRKAIAEWDETVAIAAVNAPGQIVISGAGADVAQISAQLNAEGIKTKALTVSHAFHSPLMRPMLAEYEQVVRQISFRPPTAKFLSCVNGSVAGDEIVRPEYWLRNVIDPVQFAVAARTLEAERVDICIEVGPHPVLLGMARQCVHDDSPLEWLSSARKDADVGETLLGSVARIYVRGGNVDWAGFDRPYSRRRISVPTYAFAGRRYWLKDLKRSALPDVRGPGARVDQRERPRALQTYDVVWRKVNPAAASTESAPWVILADQQGVGAELTDAVHELGVETTLVVPGKQFQATGTRSYTLDPTSPGDLTRLWEAVANDSQRHRVVHLWNLDAVRSVTPDADALERAIGFGLSSAVHVVQALAAAGVSHPALWIVTQNAVSVGPHNHTSVAIAQAPVWGLGRTVALEHPELWGGLIDVSHADARSAARAIARELVSSGPEDQVALTPTGRYAARLVARAKIETAQSHEAIVRREATYLVTGGVGALGLHVARWLVERGARHIVLASRHAALSDSVKAAIEPLQRAGAEVSVVSVDVSTTEGVDTLLARIAATQYPLRGIVHAAGVDTTIPLTALSGADIASALAAKVRGAWLLHERTRASTLDLFVYFSSLASVLGSQTRGHYAAANAFLDALALERRRLGLPAIAINWGPWSGGGMATGAHLQQFERIGNLGIDPAAALDALDTIVRRRETNSVVADIDWETFRPIYESRRLRPILSEIPAQMPVALLSNTSSDEDHSAADVGRVLSDLPTDWIAALRGLPPAEREPELARRLQLEVAETLGFDSPASVALDRNFYEIGMDSLMMADLVGRLKKRVGFSCSALIFDHPDVRTLASKLIDRLSLDAGSVIQPSISAGQVASEEESGGWVPRPSSSLGRGPAGSEPGSIAVLEAPTDAVARLTGPGSAEAIRYDAALEPQIFAFQTQAWPHRNSDLIPVRWRWMYVQSARRLSRAPLVWLYRDGNAIVGHMGSIPVRLKLGDEERDTSWLVETMVLPAYRSQAIGSRVMEEAHEDLPFSLSLGQTVEMREIQFRLGWKQVAALQTAQFLARPENVLRGKLPRPAAYAAGLGLRASATLRDLLGERRQCEARIIDRFDERHDRLWQVASRDLTCAVVRNASYLNWKYVDQPGQQFLRLELSDGGDVKGIAVWMFRNADDTYRYRRAFLVDLVTPLADPPSVRQVIRAACAAATAGEADALMCYHVDARLTDALRDCGFHLRKPGRFLLVYPGTLSGTARQRLLSPSSWFVMHGDSDIDRPW